MALFLFPVVEAALAYLPTALFVALRPLFLFRQAQYIKVFWLFALFRNSSLLSVAPTSVPFLFSFSLTLALCSPLCPLLRLSFHLNLFGRSGRNCLFSPPAQSGYNGSPDTYFYRKTTQLMSWPDGERYSCSLQFVVVSLLLSLVSTLVLSWTGGILSHLNSSTHRFPWFRSRNLCSLVTLAMFPRLSSLLQRTRPSVKVLSP